MLIVIAHLIGNPIIKSVYGMNVPFTWRTSLAGLVVYYIIIGVFLVILIIGLIFRCIYIITIESFSTQKEFLGVVVEPSEKENLVM